MAQPTLFDIGEALPKCQQIPMEKRCIPGVSGRGPQGETCRTCKHKTYNSTGVNNYLKCGVMMHAWTNGPGTDIKASWPACERWRPQKEVDMYTPEFKDQTSYTLEDYAVMADYWEERGEDVKAFLCRQQAEPPF